MRTARFATALAVTAILSTAFAPAAFAADNTTATITGGTLSITNPLAGDFAAGITGVAQTANAALDTFSVSDLTGSGAGWNVTVQATQFTTGGVGPRTLPANSLTMSQPAVTSPDTTSPDPIITAGPYTLDGGTAVKIASAAVDTGMGTYNFDATTLTLALAANVYAGAYTSTVTVSIVTAP